MMKKICRRIVKIFIFAALLMMINKALIFMLVDDADDQFRFFMYDFYHQEKVDVLFLGSSHVFCGVNPQVLENIWGKDVYLAATSVQKPDASYYLLKEATKKYKLETVYLDMYYWQYRDDPKKRTDYQMQYIRCISDYMKPSLDKILFLLDAGNVETYLDSFFVPARYGDKLFDLNYIEKVMKSKKSSVYRNYECPEDIAAYYYKGFIRAGGALAPGSQMLFADNAFAVPVKEEPVSDYSMKYLKKIIELCKNKGIRLVLFTTPMTEYHTAMIGNYDTYSAYIARLAAKNGVEFYDFNLLKSEYGAYTEDMYLDSHHLSGFGADVFSADFARMMQLEKNEIAERFYTSLEQKYAAQEERCFGLLLERKNEDYRIIPVTNRRQIRMEYRICETCEETGETRLIRDYADADEFEISYHGDVTISVWARQKGENEACCEASIYVSREDIQTDR